MLRRLIAWHHPHHTLARRRDSYSCGRRVDVRIARYMLQVEKIKCLDAGSRARAVGRSSCGSCRARLVAAVAGRTTRVMWMIIHTLLRSLR